MIKTAIQEANEAYKNKSDIGFSNWWYQNKERLLEREKQDIIEAYAMGSNHHFYSKALGEEYYDETFKKSTEL